MNNSTNKIFLSVHKGQDGTVNALNTDKLCSLLRREDVAFKVIDGVYKDFPEKSVCLSSSDIAQHEKNLELAYRVATLFNVDSFLEVHNDDAAVLHDVRTSKTERVGTLKCLPAEQACKHAAYVYSNGNYFVVV